MSVTTFLSYPSERFQEVEPIAKYVRSLGAECWFDKESLVGGDDWDVERASAQRDCDLFLAVISRETVSRDGVIHREIGEAIERARDKRAGKIYIVPLQLDDVEVPKPLDRYHWIDLRKDTWRTALAKTLEKSAKQNGRDPSPALQIAAASRTSQRTQPHGVSEEDESGSRRLEYFTYEDGGDTYWSYVNSELHRLALGKLFKFRRLMADWPEDRQPSYWERSISEFHRVGDLVSIIIDESYYFGRAAYPNHIVTTLNVLGPKCGSVSISELLEHPDAFAALLEYCNFVLKQPGGQFDDGLFNLDRHAADQSWELFDQFTLNDRGLVFHFSGAVLPHVMGVFEVYVPWEIIGRFVMGAVRDFLLGVGFPLGPPAPSLSRRSSLEMTSGAWELEFDPGNPGGRKPISFGADGAVGTGRNHNEDTWELSGDLLTIRRLGGKLQNSFLYDHAHDQFRCTNDPAASGLEDQVIRRR